MLSWSGFLCFWPRFYESAFFRLCMFDPSFSAGFPETPSGSELPQN